MPDAQAGLPARRAAVELLVAVLEKKQSLDEVLGRSLAKGMAARPAAARPRADAGDRGGKRCGAEGRSIMCSTRFLERGLPEKSGTLYPILLSAAAQLIFLKTPPHAVIDLAVTLAQYDPQGQALRASSPTPCCGASPRRARRSPSGLDAARVNTPDWLW